MVAMCQLKGWHIRIVHQRLGIPLNSCSATHVYTEVRGTCQSDLCWI